MQFSPIYVIDGLARVERNGAVVIRQRQIIRLRFLVQVTALFVVSGVAGVEIDSLCIFSQREVVLAQGMLRNSPPSVELGGRRLDCNGRRVIIYRKIVLV